MQGDVKANWKNHEQFGMAILSSVLPRIISHADFSILLSILQSMFLLPIAFLVRYIFDKVIPTGDVQNLIGMSLIILGLIVLNSGFTLWTRYLSLNKIRLVTRDLREELLVQCYRYSRSFYNKADLGKMHASIVQDTLRLDIMSNAIISMFLPSMIMTIGFCCVLIYISSSLFWVIAISIPPLYLINRFLIKNRSIHWINASHRSFEQFSKGVMFVLQMMDLTRLQAAEQYEIKQQKNILKISGLQENLMLYFLPFTIRSKMELLLYQVL